MLINPETFLRRIDQAILDAPKLITEALAESQLVKLNTENLQQGLDSEGANMPPYKDPDYANFKVSINPRNRGFWDLKVMGDYYRGIRVTIKSGTVHFEQSIKNEKTLWIESKTTAMGLKPLGVPEWQLKEVQMKNIPIIKEKLLKKINGV
ncbi:hypothetical protein C8J95_102328 [Elizabethkingia sp. YR214]|uniref:hypothetical protein n=1 Tax=Elizabethkingia sp. YR214 TaxID=2135667 RepID=UPI000D319C67|nr:hypothetical protein [Elizabethkingia sp. YR214]PUB34662.1 hypothetical protein C8J95_102328 [Elizabethkingia sp. YR214]